MPTDQLSLRALLQKSGTTIAPLVLNAMMARLAEQAGFAALYLGGGAMGYLTTVTEANLSLPDMVQAGLGITSVSSLPLILDGACGWGDPMHMHRTIGMAEAAGFSAIEIEDQILPKRAHHHVGLEHIIPTELMVAKIEEALAARRNSEFMVIARTNALRTDGLDEALRRGEAYAKAGADMLFVLAREPSVLRTIAERLPRPLMYMTPAGGLADAGISASELAALGYTLIVDPSTPLLAMHRALRQSYAAIAAGRADSALKDDAEAEQARVHETIGLMKLLEIEARTVERS
ncbi:MAG: isocitrate lyase/PEP mutase family protein [Alphaproteobacteria bacterium]|nr:MAG: isocitrate lyase/PEP mutase family protein [Alphaproteobacteria bacterium]